MLIDLTVLVGLPLTDLTPLVHSPFSTLITRMFRVRMLVVGLGFIIPMKTTVHMSLGNVSSRLAMNPVVLVMVGARCYRAAVSTKD